MLAHDKKVAAKKGQPTSGGYKPRAEHPLLHQQQQQEQQAQTQEQQAPQTAPPTSNNGESR
jgi:hypothetical protein